MPPPTTVSGGCLCGAIRYQIDFTGPDAWPPKTHTCQCTQCRKRSGALVVPWIDTAPSRVLWSSSTADNDSPHTTTTTTPSSLPYFAEYSASQGAHVRGFCARCGSPLTFRSRDAPGELEVATGSVGGEVMAGEYGEVLGRASGGHFWCGGRRAVEGVTDLEGGKRFREGGGSEEVGG